MKRFIACIVCIGIVAFVSCSYENTATVTIDTGIRQQAQLSWFDRVLAFFSFAQPLQADQPPVNLPYTVNLITVNVSAPDMQTITTEIPIDTGKITFEVPAGSQRTFEVVAGELVVEVAPVFFKYYGGITTVDLSPGEHVALEIEIGKLCIPDGSYIHVYVGGVTYTYIEFNDINNTFDLLEKVELLERSGTGNTYYSIQSISGPFSNRKIYFNDMLIKTGYCYTIKTYNKYGYYIEPNGICF